MPTDEAAFFFPLDPRKEMLSLLANEGERPPMKDDLLEVEAVVEASDSRLSTLGFLLTGLVRRVPMENSGLEG